MSRKTFVVAKGRTYPATIHPGERGRVIVQWTDGVRIIDAEADTVMEAADRVSAKLSKE